MYSKIKNLFYSTLCHKDKLAIRVFPLFSDFLCDLDVTYVELQLCNPHFWPGQLGG